MSQPRTWHRCLRSRQCGSRAGTEAHVPGCPTRAGCVSKSTSPEPEQPALTGWLPFNAPGEPVVLHQGRLTLTSETLPELDADGQVRLSWNGGAQLRWTADLPQDYETQREWRLWSPPHKRSLQVEMHGLTGSGETHATTEGQGWSNGLRFGSADVSLQRLVAHWVNLPDLGPARPVGPPVEDPGGFWRRATSWRARIRDWDVRIDSRADLDEVLRVCRRDRTFALTHVMEVHRGDGSTFTGDQAHQLLEVLQLAVSFALGRSCCPTAPVGYAPDGRAAWSEWGPSRCDHAGLGAGRWWYERRGQDLVEMLEGFLRHWDDDSGRQTLKFTATSAVVAGEQGFVEQRLVTAASALEHLCWVTDVREGGVSETSYRNVPAHDRLRSLLTALRVPVIIDVENLPTLAAQRRRAGRVRWAPRHHADSERARSSQEHALSLRQARAAVRGRPPCGALPGPRDPLANWLHR